MLSNKKISAFFSTRNLLITSFSCCALLSGVSYADVDTGHKIQQISERVALMASEIKEIEMETELREKQILLRKIQNEENIAITGGVSNSTSPVPTSSLRYIPVIQEVEGSGNRITARLGMGDNQVRNVRSGDALIDDWIVGEINVRTVILQRGEERITLSFGHQPTERIRPTDGIENTSPQ